MKVIKVQGPQISFTNSQPIRMIEPVKYPEQDKNVLTDPMGTNKPTDDTKGTETGSKLNIIA